MAEAVSSEQTTGVTIEVYRLQEKTMQMTAFPFWKIKYQGSSEPKTIDGSWLEVAREFVATHDTTSIMFYVDVDVEINPQNVKRKERLNERELTKEELASVTPEWVKERVEEAGQMAAKFFGLNKE
ncbi:MAG TPA: hypothetical protein VHE60_15525 [Pyrinomonadaceae bacterium]|nr:hypothetical protein [Pyrinomonadaceae bacterium]